MTNLGSKRARGFPGSRTLLGIAASRTGVLGLTSVGNLVVRTVSSILLTRLLKPSDFGIVGIITAIFFTVTMVTDLGFEAFLVRHERADRHFHNVIWTIHAKRGLLLFAAVAISSPAIAAAFGKPVISRPLAVASATFAINGFASLSLMTSLRHDRARELSIIDFGLQIFQTVGCIILAFYWRSAWAIIVMMLVQSTVRAGLSYVLFGGSSHRPAHDATISREFLSFSRVVLMSSALSLLIGQSDKMVLARLFSLQQFGFYAIALTIASAPAGFADSYMHRIVFPVYARTWREAPNELPRTYYAVTRWTSAVYAFGCGGLIGSAPLLVALLYDPRYASAANYICWLVVSTALRFPNVAAAGLLTAIGDIRGTLRVNVVRVIWLAAAIPTGFVFFGAIGVVAAVGLIEVPAMIYSWLMLERVRTFALKQELLFLALVGSGALGGYSVNKVILGLFPHL